MGLSVLLSILSIAVIVGVPAAAIYLASVHDIPLDIWWPVMIALLIVWGVVFGFFVVAILTWERQWKGHLKTVRTRRGLREPLARWLKELERDRRGRSKSRPAPAAQDPSPTESLEGAADTTA